MTVVLVVAVVLTLTTTVIVTSSFGFSTSMVTVTLRVELLVVAVPLVVFALEMSTNEEKVSSTVTAVTGAVPVLVNLIEYVAFWFVFTWVGETEIVIPGLTVPVLAFVSWATLLLVFASAVFVVARAKFVNANVGLGKALDTLVRILNRSAEAGLTVVVNFQTYVFAEGTLWVIPEVSERYEICGGRTSVITIEAAGIVPILLMTRV